MSKSQIVIACCMSVLNIVCLMSYMRRFQPKKLRKNKLCTRCYNTLILASTHQAANTSPWECFEFLFAIRWCVTQFRTCASLFYLFIQWYKTRLKTHNNLHLTGVRNQTTLSGVSFDDVDRSPRLYAPAKEASPESCTWLKGFSHGQGLIDWPSVACY